MGQKIESEFYLKLIKSVREKPILYEKNHKNYYNRNKRNDAWQDVANQTDRAVSECKARWKLLRERFCKQMKRADGFMLIGNGETDENEWEYYKEMIFLKESIIPRRSHKEKDLSSSLEEPIINEMFINMNAITEDESNSSNSNLSKCTKRSLESNKSPGFDLAPLKIERIMDTDFYNSNIYENKRSSTKCNKQIGAVTEDLGDELFVKNIANLIRDLPIEVKDRFQADMYTEVFRLRGLYRNC
uniref:Transcription factor Adf-1 n=1 Tax=Bactrocera dorsalis TaxID=27457 RepID=A0A034WBL5_BACDO